MVGGRNNLPNVMKEYNIAVAVLTLGGDGAEVFFDGNSHVVPGFKATHVADTTGAGDAFWGGFLSYILNQGVSTTEELNMQLLCDAAKYGNVSGCLAVQEKGAISSLPTRQQVEEFLAKN